MSKISEQMALEVYPKDYVYVKCDNEDTNYTEIDDEGTKWLKVDSNKEFRDVYTKCYDQAMQDFLEKACDYLKRNYPSIFDTYQESGYNEIEKFKEHLKL